MAFVLPALTHGVPVNAEQHHMLTRARRGGVASRQARSKNGYATMQFNNGVWRVRWRWRNEKRWKNGSVRTADEARAWVEAARDKLAQSEEPGEMPHFDLRTLPVKPNPRRPDDTRTDEEIEAARARMRELMANPVRCDDCGMLKPCSPCIPELRAMARGARRGAE